jgi:hypothetical protein
MFGRRKETGICQECGKHRNTHTDDRCSKLKQVAYAKDESPRTVATPKMPVNTFEKWLTTL